MLGCIYNAAEHGSALEVFHPRLQPCHLRSVQPQPQLAPSPQHVLGSARPLLLAQKGHFPGMQAAAKRLAKIVQARTPCSSSALRLP